MKLKVWGFSDFRIYKGEQVQTREVVAVRSVAELVRLTGMGRSTINNYAAETGNETEVAVAMSKPGTIFWRPLNEHRAEFVEAEAK